LLPHLLPSTRFHLYGLDIRSHIMRSSFSSPLHLYPAWLHIGRITVYLEVTPTSLGSSAEYLKRGDGLASLCESLCFVLPRSASLCFASKLENHGSNNVLKGSSNKKIGYIVVNCGLPQTYSKRMVSLYHYTTDHG